MICFAHFIIFRVAILFCMGVGFCPLIEPSLRKEQIERDGHLLQWVGRKSDFGEATNAPPLQGGKRKDTLFD